MTRDIDRPLGQPAARRQMGNLRPTAPGLFLGFAMVAAIAASGVITARDRGFRDPAAAAVAAPVVAATQSQPDPDQTAHPASTGSVSRRSASDGPSIIKVGPQETEDGKGVIIIRDPSAVGQDLRVAHIPDRALIEETETGLLPVRGADGRRPFDVYARPWSGARGARIAIVIGGLGLSQTGTQEAIQKLPPEVTLGFSPQGNSLDRWMQTARRKGHELVMQLPLEPFDYPNVNPGRNTLLVDAMPEENAERLHAALARTTNYVGVMNYMGARFIADGAAMSPLMEELGERGLAYLDDGTSSRSTAPDLALANRVPLALADATIDAERERGAILKKLDELERVARAKGFALGTGSAFDVTVDAVAQWIGEVKRRGIEIVPVSAVATDPERG